jgi:hypothetical protein
MSALVLALPAFLSSFIGRRHALRPTMELRIDVQQSPGNIEAELDALNRRRSSPGSALRNTSPLPIHLPGFAFHHREADGEHYIYVEDVLHRRLAGYTVFNRLVELDRRIDPLIRGPHSKYAAAYQRRGIASAVYQWGLERFCLISGARQSEAAHALWRSLGRRYPLGYVTLRDKEVRYLGLEIPPELRDDLETRMILLGRGCTFDKLRPRYRLKQANEKRLEPRIANIGRRGP